MRKHSKHIVFGLILIAAVGIVFFSNHSQLLVNTNKLEQKDYVLEKGNYTIGKDIAEGSYDFLVLKDTVIWNGYSYYEGDKFLGKVFSVGNILALEGNGSIKLTKSVHTPISNKDDIFKIKSDGFYTVGREIPSGKYEVLTRPSDFSETPTLLINDGKTGDGKESLSITDSPQFVDLVTNDQIVIKLKQSSKNDSRLIELRLVD